MLIKYGFSKKKAQKRTFLVPNRLALLGHFKIQIYESVRKGKKVRRRIIRSFGVAKTPQEVESVTRFASSELDNESAKQMFLKKTTIKFSKKLFLTVLLSPQVNEEQKKLWKECLVLKLL
ncbi:MAG: hypothetical protein K2X39_06550 [Silvanigrellaceae bacterium]|nr:hypothetical protein [Silvanigrellaceae bacterium]